jgi:hypothetical protein
VGAGDDQAWAVLLAHHVTWGRAGEHAHTVRASTLCTSSAVQ